MSWKADADANPVVEDVFVTPVGAGGGAGRPGGRSGGGRRRGRRRAGRRRGGQPVGLGGGGPGPGGREPGRAHGRARASGATSRRRPTPTSSTSGSSPRPLPLRRLDRPGHGHRGTGDAHGRVPRGGRGGPGRLLELDPSWPAGASWSARAAPTTWPAGPTACVVITLARPERLPETAGYVTSPGHRVVSVVTDKGVLRRDDRTLRAGGGPGGGGQRRGAGARVRGRLRLRAGGGAPRGGAAGDPPGTRCRPCVTSTASGCSWTDRFDRRTTMTEVTGEGDGAEVEHGRNEISDRRERAARCRSFDTAVETPSTQGVKQNT